MNKEVLKNRAKLCAITPIILVVVTTGMIVEFLREVGVGFLRGAREVRDSAQFFKLATKHCWNWKPENEVKK